MQYLIKKEPPWKTPLRWRWEIEKRVLQILAAIVVLGLMLVLLEKL
jgi:hypothetical protein